MLIRWNSGEKSSTTIEDQERIIRNMEREESRDIQLTRKPITPPTAVCSLSTSYQNRRVEFPSERISKCHHCRKGLSDRPIIMIDSEPFCYRCAKSEYPKRMEEACAANFREAHRIAPIRNEYNSQLNSYEQAKRSYAASRSAFAEIGFYSERNKWIIAWAVAISVWNCVSSHWTTGYVSSPDLSPTGVGS